MEYNFGFKTLQVDTRNKETIKRIKKVFEENQELILARSIRPHGFDCKDPDTCNNDPCWQWEPDKIVGKPYKVDSKTLKKV